MVVSRWASGWTVSLMPMELPKTQVMPPGCFMLEDTSYRYRGVLR
jgi:hypothetical protein